MLKLYANLKEQNVRFSLKRKKHDVFLSRLQNKSVKPTKDTLIILGIVWLQANEWIVLNRIISVK